MRRYTIRERLTDQQVANLLQATQVNLLVTLHGDIVVNDWARVANAARCVDQTPSETPEADEWWLSLEVDDDVKDPGE
jgi:hypothetical protein